MIEHDITHCNTNKCEKKETCHRWLAYKECLDGKYTYPVSVSNFEQLKSKNNECKYYWKKER